MEQRFFLLTFAVWKGVTSGVTRWRPIRKEGGNLAFCQACQGSCLKRMEIDINKSRKPREVFDVTPTQPCGNEGPKDSRKDGRYITALERLVTKCKAAADYSTANFGFDTGTQVLRTLGCPEELIEIYDLKLAAFFSRKNEVTDAARNIIELFMDNHGNINNNKE